MVPFYYKCEDCPHKVQIFSEEAPLQVLHQGCAGEMKRLGALTSWKV